MVDGHGALLYDIEDISSRMQQDAFWNSLLFCVM